MGAKKPSSQTSTSESKPWAPAIPHLENLLNQADKLFNEQGGINAEFVEKELADLTPEMQSTINGMLNNQGFKDLAQNIGNAAQQGIGGIGQGLAGLGAMAQGQLGMTTEDISKMAGELYDQGGVDTKVGELTKNVQEGLKGQVQALNQRASASGGMGSSRAGVAEGVASGKAADAIASGTAQLQTSAMQDAMNKAMGIAGQNQQAQIGGIQGLGNLGIQSGQLQSGLGGMINSMNQNQQWASGMLQNQAQNVLNNKWFNQTGQQQMGWDQLNKYLGIAGTIGGMGGTNTTTSTSSGGSSMGGLGSMMGGVGSMMGGIGSMGGSFSGIGSMFSDERLKSNIMTVVKSVTNSEGKVLLPRVVAWDWNELAHELFKERGIKVPKEMGVLAQDLEACGLAHFVEYHDTEVEGLDGTVRAVHYDRLKQYSDNIFEQAKAFLESAKATVE